MSIRIYIGNLPQGFNPKEFDKILKSVSESIRFKAVLDKETKECRGFGFATTNNEDNANLLIQKLNGFEFNGSKLRVELSEKKDSASNKFSVSNISNFFINNTASRAFAPFAIFCIS